MRTTCLSVRPLFTGAPRPLAAAACWLATASLALALAGCAATPSSSSADSATVKSSKPRRAGSAAKSQIPDPAPDNPGRRTAPISPTDACADRLHELTGPLLFYYALHKRLPERLDQLQDVDGTGGPIPPEQLRCPVSGKPYVYNPQGITAPDKPGLLVLYDAEPSHSGLRWAISVEPTRNPAQPLIAHLVAVPETVFHRDSGPTAPSN